MFIEMNYTYDSGWFHPLMGRILYNPDAELFLWKHRLDNYWYITEDYPIIKLDNEVCEMIPGHWNNYSSSFWMFRKDNYFIAVNNSAVFYDIYKFETSSSNIIIPGTMPYSRPTISGYGSKTLYKYFQKDNSNPGGIGQFKCASGMWPNYTYEYITLSVDNSNYLYKSSTTSTNPNGHYIGEDEFDLTESSAKITICDTMAVLK